jgi:Flp pilus assembly protein TadD
MQVEGNSEAEKALQEAERLFRAGRWLASAKLYQQNFHAAPDKRLVLHRLIAITFRIQDFASCVEFARRALRIEQDHAGVWMKLASSLRNLSRVDESLKALDEAIARLPDSAILRSERAAVLADIGRIDESLTAFDEALRLDPGCARGWAQYAHVLKLLGRYGEAEEAIQRAITAEPDNVVAWQSLALLDLDMHRPDRAVAQFDKILARNPKDALTHLVRSEALLWRGDYAAGWAEFAWRWKTRFRNHKPDQPYALWTGAQPLAGKRLMLVGEVGLGDFIMFARYVKPLQLRGATLVLHAPAALVRLFGAMNPDIQVVDAALPPPPADYQCPIMDLPRAFDTRVDTVPSEFPYLTAPSAAREEWARRLGPKVRRRVGLVWSSKANRNIDMNPVRQRSVPLSLLQPLFDEDFEFHALQREIEDADRRSLPEGRMRVHDAALFDFAETAALASQMDVVISIDTSVAHVAGGLGKPLWMMLPYWSDYRWGGALPQSPWYPDARLFRQQSPGDWAGVVTKLVEALKGFAPN